MPTPQELAGAAQPQIAPNAAPQGVDLQSLIPAIKEVLSQAVDENGYLDIEKVAMLWPQIAQQMGINIPFETLLKMIESNPEVLQSIVQELGIAGISYKGQQMSPEQLMGQSQIQGGVPPQGAASMAAGG